MSAIPSIMEVSHRTEKEKTFRKWVADYSDQLYRYCRKRILDDELCKDLLQETYLAAWRNMDGFKGQASVKNWLFVILKSKLTDHYRKTFSKPLPESFDIEYDDHLFFDDTGHWRKGMYPKDWSVDFTNRIESTEFQMVLESCTAKLKDIQQTVFTMKYIDDCDSEEICKQLGISLNNYWVLIHRAKLQLRACLEKNWL